MTRTVVERERAMIRASFTPGFSVSQPERGRTPSAPYVFCTPHSGRVYPDAFLETSRLSHSDIRKSEDSFVDELFASVPALGAPLLAADFPRAYLDLNREPYELDPQLFAEAVPAFANTRSIRVMSGLGTIARVVADNEPIYRDVLPVAVAYERIERLYRPFHRTLAALLEERRQRFGQVVLVDCHSMPSLSASTARQEERADIVLGDRFGMSCTGELTLLLSDALQAEGFRVALNRPYAGGYITEHYGRPKAGCEAIQIELNRGLYMDEARFERLRTFGAVRDAIEAALVRVMETYPLGRMLDAAE
ncbi:MAG: N-formylglutamate amidohydrolase [Pseudomonadota bacterium]